MIAELQQPVAHDAHVLDELNVPELQVVRPKTSLSYRRGTGVEAKR